MANKSYFPLLIKETVSTRKYVVNSPQEIPSGVQFTVVECNVGEADQPKRPVSGGQHE